MTDTFRQAMEAAGLPAPANIVADGALHRFRVDGDRSRSENGWYLLHGDDPPAGAFGCWKRGISETWNDRPTDTLSLAAKTALRARMEAARAERTRMQAEIHAEARKRAAEIWQAAEPAPERHPYLVEKAVKAYGLRLSRGSLVLPLGDSDGTLHGLQFINANGSKKYLTGTKKAGAYFAIGGRPDKVLYICEGYATGASIHEATGAPVAVAFDAGNLRLVAEAVRAKFPALKIVVCGDNDAWTEGNPGATKAKEAAAAVNGVVALPTFQNTASRPTDFNDLHQLQGPEELKQQIEAALNAEARQKTIETDAEPARIRVIDATDFMALEFPPRENILYPWLPRQGLAMVYAPRGIGKTHFSLGVSYAAASGGTFLRWHAPTPRGVLFIDGEMPGGSLQERLGRISMSNPEEPSAPFRIITPDLQPPSGMIDLTREDDQKALTPYLEGVDLIVVDNISTLCRHGKENEGESWLPVQAWALQQRAVGRSVLFVHHAGKNGAQRGSSRREDVLDTVISLRRPGDYTPDKGANFEVHFEKARGILGEDTKPFEARLITTPDDRQEWTITPLEQSTAEKVAALLNEGIPQREIPDLLNLTKGAVSKAKNRAQEMGLLDKPAA